MKYFKKFLIVWLFALFWVSFCSADLTWYDYSISWLLNFYSTACTNSQTFNATSSVSFAVLSYCSMTNDARYTYQSANSIYDSCVYYSWYNSDLYVYRCNSSTFSTTDCENLGNFSQSNSSNTYCWTSLSNDSSYYYFYNSSSSSLSIKKADIKAFSYNHNVKSSLSPSCPSCPSCPSQYTSLECQTEYSLIPISEVTENYCTSNYDLISPADCPISSWTWDIQRSAVYLNNIQYAWANSIYININDILDWSTTYVDSWTSFVVDVDWYNADTGYLADILTVQEYHPDSEDFTVAFVGGLTLILPYVVVALFVVFVRKLITKIFKS